MKAEERLNQIVSEIKKKHLVEILYFPILMAVYIYFEMKYENELNERISTGIIFIAFGLFHILASNVMSFLYNLNWVILPFAPKATPVRLKIIGVIILIASSLHVYNIS